MARRVGGVLLLAAVVVALLPPLPAARADALPHLQHRIIDGLPTPRGVADGLSQRVLAPIPFSLVGVSIPEGTRVLVRTGDGDGSWLPWQEAEAIADDGDGPDPATPEASASAAGWQRMSEPIWVGDASSVQVRVLGGDPGDVDVHLVDSLGLSRSLLRRAVDAWRGAWRGVGPATASASSQPPIVSRAQWGADESLRRGSPSYSASTRAGILHHTATSNDYPREQAAGVVRAIYGYHTRSLGWSDIGYNLLVDRYGTVYEGRAGGVDRGVIGAHAGGFNTETFGVAILGTFMSGLPPAPAVDAAVAAIGWKFRLHGINPDPNATVDVVSRGSTRYPQGHTARMHTLAGHRDVSTTACPGDALYAHLPAVRQQVFAGTPPPVPDALPGDPGPLLPRLLPQLGPSLRDLGVPLSPPAGPPRRPAPPADEGLDLPLLGRLPLGGR